MYVHVVTSVYITTGQSDNLVITTHWLPFRYTAQCYLVPYWNIACWSQPPGKLSIRVQFYPGYGYIIIGVKLDNRFFDDLCPFPGALSA